MITSKPEHSIIRPAPSGAGQTTPSQPGHYPLNISQEWLSKCPAIHAIQAVVAGEPEYISTHFKVDCCFSFFPLVYCTYNKMLALAILRCNICLSYRVGTNNIFCGGCSNWVERNTVVSLAIRSLTLASVCKP